MQEQRVVLHRHLHRMRGPDAPQARGDEQRDAARQRPHIPLPMNGCDARRLRRRSYVYRTERVRGAGTGPSSAGHALVVDHEKAGAAAGDAPGLEPGA